MNYSEALAYLHELCKFGINLGLERITNLLNLLDNPHFKIKTIHVGGTNGKGSTTAMLASILESSGYKTGVFTSPHLHDYRERIKINGQEISEADFSKEMEYLRRLIPQVLKKVGENPTEFEVLTALALNYFAKEKVDIAIFEVGMGGRLDSTNVVMPEVAVITSISMDHTDYLGSDLFQIAQEKAGIIKKGVPVVISRQDDQVEKVLAQKAQEKQAPFYRASDYIYEQISFSSYGQFFKVKTGQNDYGEFFLPLLGDHQLENAVTAIATVEVLKEKGWIISPADLKKGLEKVKWPGRLEYYDTKPQIVLDGAHNPDGAFRLSQSLPKYFNYEKLVMVLGILSDKEQEKMLAYLAPLAHTLIITKPLSPRAGNWQSLAEIAHKYTDNVLVEEDYRRAIECALNIAHSNDLVCICGSFYLVGESREYVLKTFITE